MNIVHTIGQLFKKVVCGGLNCFGFDLCFGCGFFCFGYLRQIIWLCKGTGGLLTVEGIRLFNMMYAKLNRLFSEIRTNQESYRCGPENETFALFVFDFLFYAEYDSDMEKKYFNM